MTLTANLVDHSLAVLLDERTALLGGAFYFDPIRPYSALPLKWAWELLHAQEHPVLIDVGASTGCYSLLAAHHPGLTVYAFEPVPLTCEVLRENVRLNGLDGRVKVFECGISNYNGVGVLHSVKALGGSGVSMVDGKPAYHKDCDDLPVDVMTIDSFCELHKVAPTFIKIDTEGGEKMVLEGATETIEQYHPFLLVEYSYENADQFGYNPSALVVMLEAWGYVFTMPEGTDLWCVHRDWDKKGEVTE